MICMNGFDAKGRVTMRRICLHKADEVVLAQIPKGNNWPLVVDLDRVDSDVRLTRRRYTDVRRHWFDKMSSEQRHRQASGERCPGSGCVCLSLISRIGSLNERLSVTPTKPGIRVLRFCLATCANFHELRTLQATRHLKRITRRVLFISEYVVLSDSSRFLVNRFAIHQKH